MLEIDMEDDGHLRRTIRRCTAILVLTIAITGISFQRPSDAGNLILIAMGAVTYLFFEFVEINSTSAQSNGSSENA